MRVFAGNDLSSRSSQMQSAHAMIRNLWRRRFSLTIGEIKANNLSWENI